MPPSTITPVLAYPDVRAAVTWLCDTFGFVERLRITEHRAQLMFAEGCVVVTERSADERFYASGIPRHSIMVRVAKVDAHHAHALRAGAKVIAPPTDYPFGERQYIAMDPGGYLWTFSQSIADVDPSSYGAELVDHS